MPETSAHNKRAEKIKFQDLTRLHKTIYAELLAKFEDVLKTSSFIQGPHVVAFEEQFRQYTGAKYCLGVSNGTDALEIALEALGIKQGDVVAVPSMTFAATAEAVVRMGATPLFVDADPETLCLSNDTLAEALETSGKKARALIAVHLYGRSCDMPSLKKFADQNGMALIEDCAQAHGAKTDGKHVGNFGDVGTFSFFPGKNLGAFGDAGALITNSEKLYQEMKLLRDHGRTDKYLHQKIGRNSRLDALQAALLSVKLSKLAEWTENRRALAKAYEEELKKIDQVAMLPIPNEKEAHSFHLLVIRVKGVVGTRDKLKQWLNDQAIESGIHYPLGVHQQPAFKAYPSKHSLEATEKATQEILSLPFDPLMTTDEVKRVCAAIAEFFRRGA